jgi:hypothetical protein
MLVWWVIIGSPTEALLLVNPTYVSVGVCLGGQLFEQVKGGNSPCCYDYGSSHFRAARPVEGGREAVVTEVIPDGCEYCDDEPAE